MVPCGGLGWWRKVTGCPSSRITSVSPYISANSHVKGFDSLCIQMLPLFISEFEKLEESLQGYFVFESSSLPH